MKKNIISILLATCMLMSVSNAGILTVNATSDDMNMYKNSDFIEKEQPELTEETKELISLYQRQPTEQNYLNLRDVVIKNYNAVLDRKEAKLAELKTETEGKPGGEELVAEMEEIVQEMYITYWNRINSSMLRFTDTRLLKWKIADAPQYEYIPVMGAGESIYVGRTPVTNAEYAQYISETGANAPSNWVNGMYANGEDDFPVNCISYQDAKAYCDWITEKDGVNVYRLPSESEWELAAGHMPKDADFNCGVNDGRTSVEEYVKTTRGAHGAVDFWGNVWEWTSTVRSEADGITTLGVKGGSWSSKRTDCRTEYRDEGRNESEGYEDVGFRVIKVLNGEEPKQKVELATLDAPVVSAVSEASGSITLSWQSVDNAVEYQIFRYFENTGLVSMLQTVSGTSITINNLEIGKTYSYIVQPISYTAISDNVSAEYVTKVTCGQTGDNVLQTSSMKLYNYNGMDYWLYTPKNAVNNMPLVIYLHGKLAGSASDTFISEGGFPKWLNDGDLGDVPAYVLLPVLPLDEKDWISAKSAVVKLIEKVAAENKIDSGNISLTGFSMGGVGVWELAIANPQLFRCIAPCSGSVRTGTETLVALSSMPIWTFVASEDTAVNPQKTIDFMAQMTPINPQAKITEFDGAVHTDVPTLAFLNEDIGLMRWLIGNSAEIKSFDDVPKDHWAYDAICATVEKGLFEGTTNPNGNGEGHFDIDGTMSRAEFITTIVRWLYSNELIAMSDNEVWYTNAMTTAYNHGLILDGEFDNNTLTDGITREEMALIASRAIDLNGEDISSELINIDVIPDSADISNQYKNAVSVVYTKGIILGIDEKGSFMPKETVTRAQGATILYRLIDENVR